MAESDVHIDMLIYLREVLRDHFRDVPLGPYAQLIAAQRRHVWGVMR
jgi:hypothetical protein